MQTTIKDIAKMADVSITTVSRVLNNEEGASLETREKILRIAKDLNYTPNRLARSLVTKRTNTLGIILPDITNPFFPEIVRAVEDTANKFGYNLIICNTDDNSEKESLYLQVLKEKYVDGIIFTSSTNPSDKNIRQLLDYKIPFVLLDRYMDIDHLTGVYTDGILGMYEAVNYLISMGHDKIAFISGPKGSQSVAQRYDGYLNALKEANIPIRPELIREGNYKISGGEKAMSELLSSKQDFTAVACANDLTAIGAIEILTQNNIKVPEQVSVTGFDDITLSKVISPKLTTVKQPCYEMGEKAAKILLKLIEGRALRKPKMSLKPKLIIRDSVSKRG